MHGLVLVDESLVFRDLGLLTGGARCADEVTRKGEHGDIHSVGKARHYCLLAIRYRIEAQVLRSVCNAGK